MSHKSHPESRMGGSLPGTVGGLGGFMRLHPLPPIGGLARTCLRRLQGPAVGSRVTMNSRHLHTHVRSCAWALGETLCPCPLLPACRPMPGLGPPDLGVSGGLVSRGLTATPSPPSLPQPGTRFLSLLPFLSPWTYSLHHSHPLSPSLPPSVSHGACDDQGSLGHCLQDLGLTHGPEELGPGKPHHD